MSRLDRSLFAAVATIVAVVCIAGLYRATSTLFLHVPLDPNEGWNAYHAAAAIAGHGLYPSPKLFFFNNYPPISFYVVGALGGLIGDNIFAGRIVSMLAFALIVSAIFFLARKGNCKPPAALFGAVYFAATVLLFSDYVGMDDPQLLGHALQLVGLFLIVPPSRSIADIAFAALLFVAGFYVKHNLFVLPLASILWLVTENRRSAFHLAFLGYVFGYSYLVTADVLLGVQLLPQFFSPRIWSSANLAHALYLSLPWLALPGAALALLAATQWQDRFVRFCMLYAGVALAAALAFAGGAGVDTNAWFDMAIAVSFAAALFIDRMAARELTGFAATGLLAPLFVVLCVSIDADWFAFDFWTHPMHDETVVSETDIAFLRAHSGNALCETLSLCYWAAKPETVDVFNLGQAYATRVRGDHALINLLNGKKFAVVEFETLAPFALTLDVLSALNRNYKVARTSDNGTFFVPR
jgi:hypothetical protein